DLLSQEVKQQRHALQLAWGAAASLLFLAGLAGFFFFQAQRSELATRQQAAGSTYRSALQEQRSSDEAALAYLAKAARLDPANRNIGTAMLMLLADRHWPSLAMPDLAHSEIVNSARFSPDTTRVVTASADGTAVIWDARTGRPLAGPLKHEDVVFGARFDADGSRVLTWSNDNTAQIWDASTANASASRCSTEPGSRARNSIATGRWWSPAHSTAPRKIWDARSGERMG